MFSNKKCTKHVSKYVWLTPVILKLMDKCFATMFLVRKRTPKNQRFLNWDTRTPGNIRKDCQGIPEELADGKDFGNLCAAHCTKDGD